MKVTVVEKYLKAEELVKSGEYDAVITKYSDELEDGSMDKWCYVLVPNYELRDQIVSKLGWRITVKDNCLYAHLDAEQVIQELENL